MKESPKIEEVVGLSVVIVTKKIHLKFLEAENIRYRTVVEKYHVNADKNLINLNNDITIVYTKKCHYFLKQVISSSQYIRHFINIDIKVNNINW